jgi:N-acyl-D-aspartate/D-glutamate deacylase
MLSWNAVGSAAFAVQDDGLSQSNKSLQTRDRRLIDGESYRQQFRKTLNESGWKNREAMLSRPTMDKELSRTTKIPNRT